MKKVWITGSHGFIGKELVPILKQEYDVTCITHDINDNFLDNEIIKVNFLNEKSISNLIEKLGVPDVFIHLGWASMSNSESSEHLEFNVNASKNLITVFFQSGLKKFVFLGSRDEYGEREGNLKESMIPVGRITKYAQAKKIVAEYGLNISEKLNKVFIHIRLFNVYGPGQKENSLINTLYRNFYSNEISELGPCMHFREYIHISEVCKGIQALLTVNKSVTVNLGSGKTVRLKDFVNLFWSELGQGNKKIIFNSEQIRKNDPIYPESYADLTKLKELTNWIPSLSLEEGIRITIKKLNSLYSFKNNKIF